MMDPQTAYFFKKYYRNIIKWWFVVYNPVAQKIWPSKAEEEEALRKEEEELVAIAEAQAQEALLEDDTKQSPDEEDAYNEATGSYSGLYGKGPVDADTQSMLNQIMNLSNSQSCIDSILQSSSEIAPASDVILPPEQEEIIQEANIIYERLLREAKEDEERKAAEIEAIKRAMEANA